MPIVTGVVGFYLAGLGHVQLWQVYLVTLFSAVGGVMLVAYVKTAFIGSSAGLDAQDRRLRACRG